LLWPEPELVDALEQTGLLPLWLGRRIESLVCGDQTLENWQAQNFQDPAHQLFLELGSNLDQVNLSVLQSDDVHLAQEWFFKLQDGEADFISLAAQSIGSSSKSAGHLGPIRLEELSSPLDRLVLRSQPGVIQPPLRISNGRSIVMRLDDRHPAQWDPTTRQELIGRLHRSWLAGCIDALITSPPAAGSPCPIPPP